MVHQQTKSQNQLAVRRMLIGAGIGLTLITGFLLNVRNPDPAWPQYWMVRPLLNVPLAGAGGALFFHLSERFRTNGGWKGLIFNLICLIVFIIALWMGAVLGLDGTLWD